MSSPPLIGITCGRMTGSDTLRYGVNTKYVDALREAGAEVVLLPPGTAAAVAARLDGLLLSGGGDVDPARYGAAPDPTTTGVDSARDQTEVELLQLAADRSMAVLGICRGIQIINVAAGGTLHQHVDGHRQEPRDLLSHEVMVVPGASFGGLALESVRVNTLHHQTVADLGRGLKVTALSPDGVIEGLESEDGRVVAVQCHPEELTAHEWARDLFRRFVERVVAARQPALA